MNHLDKAVIVMATLLTFSVVFIVSVMINQAHADLLSAGSIWDGFTDCHTGAGLPIINCVGFNTLHSDNKLILTMLQTEITKQNQIIDNQQQEINQLMQKNQTKEPVAINSKCVKSGTGILCNP